jgi:hypothetical protein
MKTVADTQHKELLKLLNPLVDFMTANGYNYFLVAGKDGICTRHMRGSADDVGGMIIGMAKNKDVRAMLKDINSQSW